jgi:hypothetical protein
VSDSVSSDKPRLMALIFALRLTVVGLGMLAATLALFVWPFTESREWETLFVLFSVFVLLVAYVLLFIRLSGHGSRLLLLTPFPVLFLPGAKLVTVGLWVACLLVLDVFRRESGGELPFLGAQILLGVGGAAIALIPLKGWMLGVFWVEVFAVPCLVAGGCWNWQRHIKDELVDQDLDEGD